MILDPLLDPLTGWVIFIIYIDTLNSTVDIDSQLFYLLQKYNAKISDFGLAKLGPSGENSHVTTRIMGTYGYAAPEYMATGNLYLYLHIRVCSTKILKS